MLRLVKKQLHISTNILEVKILAKINYRVCDVCRTVITPSTNGYSIGIKLFRKIDICNTCLGKLRLLSTDIENEMNYLQKMPKHDKDYDVPCEAAYLQGWDDAMQVLSHHRLKGINTVK